MADVHVAHAIAAGRVADAPEDLEHRYILDRRERLRLVHRITELVLAHRRAQVEISEARPDTDWTAM